MTTLGVLLAVHPLYAQLTRQVNKGEVSVGTPFMQQTDRQWLIAVLALLCAYRMCVYEGVLRKFEGRQVLVNIKGVSFSVRTDGT